MYDSLHNGINIVIYTFLNKDAHASVTYCVQYQQGSSMTVAPHRQHIFMIIHKIRQCVSVSVV